MMRLASVLINLAIAILFFSVLYSAANIDVNIDVSTKSPTGYTLSGDTLKVAVPVEIHNKGLYPIEDVKIDVAIKNDSHNLLERQFTIKKIDSLRDYTTVFEVPVNLTQMYNKLGTYYIFHGGKFALNINVSAKYWIIAGFHARYSRNITWQPLLHAYRIYYDEIKFDGNSIKIPYFISKLPIKIGGKIEIAIRDDLGLLAKGTEKIVFDKKTWAEIKILRNADYLISRGDRWKITMRALINGIAITREFTYDWRPPLSDMGVQEKIVNNTPTIYLVFKNNIERTLHLGVYIEHIFNGSEETKNINLTVEPERVTMIKLFTLVPGEHHVTVKLTVVEYGLEKTLTYNLEV